VYIYVYEVYRHRWNTELHGWHKASSLSVTKHGQFVLVRGLWRTGHRGFSLNTSASPLLQNVMVQPTTI
jgi:hypothetical protein